MKTIYSKDLRNKIIKTRIIEVIVVAFFLFVQIGIFLYGNDEAKHDYFSLILLVLMLLLFIFSIERNIYKMKKEEKNLFETYHKYVLNVLPSFVLIDKKLFSDDVFKGRFDNAYMVYYEKLSNLWFYVNYKDRKPMSFIVQEDGEFFTLDEDEFPEYGVLKDLVDAMKSENIGMIGTISEADFKHIQSNAITKLESEVIGWLAKLDKRENGRIRDDIIALYIGILENGEGVYMTGSKAYDRQDDDWACNEDYAPEDQFYIFKNNYMEQMEWKELLDKVVFAVKKYISSQERSPLFKNRVVSVGFDDGDLVTVK